MCFTDDNGVTACRTVAEIANIINPPGGGTWWKVISKNEPIEIDFDYVDVEEADQQALTVVNRTTVEQH